MASSLRRPMYQNGLARSWHAPASTNQDLVSAFHRRLPNYSPTRLVSLEQVARDIGVKAVYLKDEGKRFGLPSFKILGASWGAFRAVVQKLGLPLDSDLTAIKDASSAHPVTLLAATDGNHGRAVARMGKILGLDVEIFVPSGMDASTAQTIKDEGAEIRHVNGSYDLAVQVAFDTASKSSAGILVQDTAFPGYDEIPLWIVEGYDTMLVEIDEQLADQLPDLVVAPVGVGSFAQAVVTHYKASAKDSQVLTVEPDTAACLYKSLTLGKPVTLDNTVPTIMSGLDCGTVSSNAWPLLQAGVDASWSVSDLEAHKAVGFLNSLGVSSGPCGASALAALYRMGSSEKTALGLDESSVVVLLSTEGARSYKIPRSTGIDNTQSLLQTLVQINSSIPGTGSPPGSGETEIAQYVTAWLEHRNIETHWLEPTRGRPSVVGVVKGTGRGKSLMFNGHLDTVTVASYDGDPISGLIKDGRLYGRGSADMKGGLAAMLVAVAQAKKDRLEGDVIFTGVADEEDLSIGTEQVLEAGWTLR